jgi:Holliday junction DNA helicase RuvB
LELKQDAALLLANCSRGIPRVANRLLKRVSDYCLVNSEVIASLRHVKETLAILGLDESGLSRLDLEVLKVLNNNFAGGPVGISTLSAYMHEDRDTLSEVVEPFLLKLGFLQRSHRGRIVTEAGKKYLKQKV